MKIICMDCQNESYSDMESLKANRHFVCARCEEKAHPYSDKQVEAYEPLGMHEPLVSYASPLDEFSANSEIKAQDQDEEVLEISDEFVIQEHSGAEAGNDLILFPEIETPAMPSEEGIYFDRIDDSLQSVESIIPENGSDPVLPEPDDTYALPEQGAERLSDSQLSNDFPVHEAESVTRSKLVSFSMSRQIVIAGACVLSIILMQTFVTPSGQIGIKAESSGKPVSSSAPVVEHKEIKEAPAPAPVAQISPTPAPSPVVAVEEKPQVAPSPTAEQPAEKQQGLYTLQVGSHQDMAEANEQAKKFRAAGFEPHVVSAEIPKRGTWYRVQVGDFSTRDEANSFGAMLRSKGLVESFIVSGL
jgi:cell division septation protein DedD